MHCLLVVLRTKIVSRTAFFSLILSLFATPSLLAQTAGGTPPPPNVTLPGPPNPFLGSQPEGKATGDVLQIDFKDAIDRGLRNNLGLLLAGDQAQFARGERWKELSELLPNLSARVQEDAQTQSLAALGFNKLFPLLSAPGSKMSALPRIVPAFNYFDARATLNQSVFNFKNLEKERAAAEGVKAAQFSYKDARELVVFAVGNAYLEAIAGAARVETAEAQLKNAQALYDKADDQQKAGLSPAIDTLRSQVELQARRQQLIVAGNDLAKLKLNLARIIGLPPGQEFVLTEKVPYQALTALTVNEYLQRAYEGRSDYQVALAQVRQAELSRRAAVAGHYPSVDIAANLGDIGVNPAQSNGTWQVNGGINIPIFAGNRVHSDVLEADAQLKQARSQLGDIRGRIDYEVRTALLDLNAAAEQVEVARSAVDLAEQTLAQSQDRFTAGVADNLEVVQAQEAVAGAHESYIESLYAHNLSKVELAHAIGDAEEGVKRFLKGKQ
ncbi:MAG TPA: TolC family protein [Candidatus Sulfotelmatobacter sp.]|nr:TolC family protein [Candidatus Sulfotelmatobacter sp.]